mmetsp:Transcript_11140/g.16822  ORF Transcript_11140/g.16822 Transcript_11140/m.16822 type:complete len:195 (-) Transcript_11140:34-618(-)
MRIEKCSFCSCSVYPGHGQMFVRNDCKVFRFCRSKCKKNFGLKRNPLRVKWTKAYRRARNKELTVDATLVFESKKNIPVRYNRLVSKVTVDAMKKISGIREARKEAHWRARRDEQHEFLENQEVRKLQRNLALIEDAELRSHAEEVVSSHTFPGHRGVIKESHNANRKAEEKLSERKIKAASTKIGEKAQEFSH